MPEDQLIATNKSKVGAVVCATVLATATTISSASVPDSIDNDNLCPTIAVVERFQPQTITDSRLSAWITFQDLRKEWLQERRAHSTVAEMAMTSPYLKIMGMGPDVLPAILAQLKSEGEKPDHWFLALAAITHENPVPTSSRGKVREMAKAWLEWGEKAGYVHLG